ncbi:MAG: glycosyltransferase family 2 protein, partial [Bacteroidota bacterium]
MNRKAIVDIGIITFNHENFIEQCIESVYEQTIIDNMRVIVIDDASTDNTSGILEQLKKKYPFHLIQHDKNKGIIQSAYECASLLESPFFCWLDGDDYWKYKDKLKVQIGFLENNPQYSACFHDAIIQQENATEDKNLNRTQFTFNLYSQFNHYKQEILPQDLINRTILPTSSVVYRKKNIPRNFWDLQTLPYSLSWKIQLEYIKKSKFYYFNQPWSVYRDHPGGFSKETS